MKPDKPTRRDAKPGEGERIFVYHYYQQLREFVVGAPAKPVAHEPETYAGDRGAGAGRAGRRAARGSQTQISLDEMVARNRSFVERVGSAVDRAMGRLRARLRRK